MGTTYRVLIVEDVSCVFQRVETKKDFLKALDEFKPDIIISDYKMPTFDGMTALKLTLERSPLTPFIIVTGSMNEDTAVECMKAGATNYVIKQHLKRLGPAVLHALEEKNIRLEKIRAEDELKKSEEKHRILFVSSRDAIMTLEPPAWTFTSGNPATLELFSAKDEADFISYAPWQLSPDKQPDGQNSKEKVKKMIEIAMQNGSHFFEWTHSRINGEEFPATVLLTKVTMVDKTFLQATVRDITERKKMEQEIQKRVKELEDFYDMAVGREVRMKQLKEQMEGLKEEMEKLKEELEKYKKP
jgi:PAS domain S-box-containing protein